MVLNPDIFTKTLSFNFIDYPSHVVTSKTRRAKYYYDDESLPKKYINGLGSTYDFDSYKKKNVLFDNRTGKPVLKNASTVDKPRTKKISGQDVHDLSLTDYERGLILNTLKPYFFSVLSKYKIKEPVTYPIVLELHYFTKRDELSDIDNYSLLFQKVLLDCLVKTKILRKVDKQRNITFEKVPNPYGFLPDDNVDFMNMFVIRWSAKKSINYERRLTLNVYEYNNKCN